MFDPTIPDQLVRIIDNPGVQGYTTGKVKKNGSITIVEVRFAILLKVFSLSSTSMISMGLELGTSFLARA